MKWSATPPTYELTLSALIREIFNEHPEDPTLLPLHLPPGEDRLRCISLTGVLQCWVRGRPPGGLLP